MKYHKTMQIWAKNWATIFVKYVELVSDDKNCILYRIQGLYSYSELHTMFLLVQDLLWNSPNSLSTMVRDLYFNIITLRPILQRVDTTYSPSRNFNQYPLYNLIASKSWLYAPINQYYIINRKDLIITSCNIF